ncbi:hypothetical protein MTO96_014081 [Rhipicephalus appendiculatus]
MDAEQQPNRENMNPQRPNRPQVTLMLHRRPRDGALPPRQARNRAQEDQRHPSHHQQQAQHQHQQLQHQQQQMQHNQQQGQHQQQQAQHHQAQGGPAEGHPGLCPEVPHGGIAPPGRCPGTVTEDTAEHGNGGSSDGTLPLLCSAHGPAAGVYGYTAPSAAPVPWCQRPDTSPPRCAAIWPVAIGSTI